MSPTMPIEEIDNPPDPSRTMEGLRDTGYQFNTALADIIDNSIAAKATKVDVSLEMDFDGEITIYVADNGEGMDREKLIEAMRYGAPPREDRSSLGKFGLGLKTASTAFCRRLSVISRASGTAIPLRATWDLDHVRDMEAWKLQMAPAEKEFVDRLDRIAPRRAGTVVVWEKVDRLLGKEYSEPGGRWARKRMKQIEESLREHAGMVYQRYLDTSDGRAPLHVDLRVNGVEVDPWDPFQPVPDSKLVAEETRDVDMGNGEMAEFTVRAFVLPHRDEVPEHLKKAARISNEMQGIYVYREDRLIHGPDWLGMFGKEPHISLLRVEFSFDHKLDQAFHIDIKKSQIILNADLYSWLKDFIGAPRRAANERYRRRQKEKTKDAAKSAHDASNNAIAGKENDLGGANIDVVNPETGEVRITQRDGQTTTARLRIITARKPGEVHVSPADGLDDGLLWEPVLIDHHKAVRLNTGHPYYHKVYVPNLSEGVTIQGMDSLLWALCAAEMNALSNNTQRHFEELRYEVSRLLRTLVADLPEPEDAGTEGDEAA